MTADVSKSRFYMWRAVFAMAHADHEVTEDERRFMQDVLAQENFSEIQRAVLQDDIKSPPDSGEMFVQIEDQKDRSDFFYYARMLCWKDGDFDAQEQDIMARLGAVHIKEIDLDAMGPVDMELEDEEKTKTSLSDDMQERGRLLGKFLKKLKSA